MIKSLWDRPHIPNQIIALWQGETEYNHDLITSGVSFKSDAWIVCKNSLECMIWYIYNLQIIFSQELSKHRTLHEYRYVCIP